MLSPATGSETDGGGDGGRVGGDRNNGRLLSRTAALEREVSLRWFARAAVRDLALSSSSSRDALARGGIAKAPAPAAGAAPAAASAATAARSTLLSADAVEWLFAEVRSRSITRDNARHDAPPFERAG